MIWFDFISLLNTINIFHCRDADAKKQDTSRNGGVSVVVWGPPLWRILHTIGFSPTDEVRTHSRNIIRFIRNLAESLPCKLCRTSYREFMTQLPPLQQMVESNDLALWLFLLHSKVNEKLGVVTPPFVQIQKHY